MFSMKFVDELVPVDNYMFKVNNRNMFKVNNKDTRKAPVALFWCLYC